MDFQLRISRLHVFSVCFGLIAAIQFTAVAQDQLVTTPENADWFERKTKWNGYDQYHFRIAEKAAYIVKPKKTLEGNPWIWRARFPGYHAEMDVMLVARGYHVAYVDVAGMFGSPKAISIGEKFYDYLIVKHKLSKTPALEGVSRGGLFVYNWAAKHPKTVACIYCDTPVLDFKSWPGGKGSGLGSAGTWKQCLAAYDFTEEQAMKFDKNPIDHAKIIAEAKIPLLHIISENDLVVPPEENTYVLKSRLEELGHKLEVISVKEGTVKSNGHHFTHPQPDKVVKFVMQHGQ